MFTREHMARCGSLNSKLFGCRLRTEQVGRATLVETVNFLSMQLLQLGDESSAETVCFFPAADDNEYALVRMLHTEGWQEMKEEDVPALIKKFFYCSERDSPQKVAFSFALLLFHLSSSAFLSSMLFIRLNLLIPSDFSSLLNPTSGLGFIGRVQR